VVVLVMAGVGGVGLTQRFGKAISSFARCTRRSLPSELKTTMPVTRAVYSGCCLKYSVSETMYSCNEAGYSNGGFGFEISVVIVNNDFICASE